MMILRFAIALLLSLSLPWQASASVGADDEHGAVLALALADAERRAVAEPSDATAWEALSRAQLAVDESAAALRSAQRAVALARDWPTAYLTLAKVQRARIPDSGWYRQLVLARQIRESLETAVALEREGAEAHLALMRYHLRAPAMAGGSKRMAADLAVAISERDPARGALAMGLLAKEKGRTEAVLDHFRRALALSGEDTELHRQTAEALGQALVELGRWSEAHALYADVLERDPDFAEGWFGLGLVAAESGEHLDDGARALHRYLSLPARVGRAAREQAHYQLGRVYVQMAFAERARDQFRLALALDPDHYDARDALEAL